MKIRELFESVKNTFIIEESFKQFDQVWIDWLEGMDIPDGYSIPGEEPIVNILKTGDSARTKEEEISKNFLDYSLNKYMFRNKIEHLSSDDILNKASDVIGVNNWFDLTPPVVIEYMIKNRIKIEMSATPFPGNPNDVSSWISVLKRSQLKDIIHYLYDVYHSFIRAIVRKMERDLLKNPDYDVIYHGSNFILYKANNMAAACKLGSRGNWCTSTRNVSNNQFDVYIEHGFEIYVVHTDVDGPWAIVVNADDGKIVEVQNAENSLGDGRDHMNKFVKQLKRAGVDVSDLFYGLYKHLGVDTETQESNVSLEEAYQTVLERVNLTNHQLLQDVYDNFTYWNSDYVNDLQDEFYSFIESNIGRRIDNVLDLNFIELINMFLDNNMIFVQKHSKDLGNFKLDDKQDWIGFMVEEDDSLYIINVFADLFYSIYKHIERGS